MGSEDAFWRGGVLCQKTLPKAVLLREKTYRRFCKLGSSTTFLDPKMRCLPWIVTHPQILPLLLAHRFSTP